MSDTWATSSANPCRGEATGRQDNILARPGGDESVNEKEIVNKAWQNATERENGGIPARSIILLVGALLSAVRRMSGAKHTRPNPSGGASRDVAIFTCGGRPRSHWLRWKRSNPRPLRNHLLNGSSLPTNQ